MKRLAITAWALGMVIAGKTQLAPLTVEKIMRDPSWMGTQPGTPVWGADSKTVYFTWNPDNAPSDSLYEISIFKKTPKKVEALTAFETPNAAEYNSNRTMAAFSSGGDLFLQNLNTGQIKRITQTLDSETNPYFLSGDSLLFFVRGGNGFHYHIKNGTIRQLTQFIKGSDGSKPAKPSVQESWLKQDQLRLFQVLSERKTEKDETEAYQARIRKMREPKPVYTEDKNVTALLPASGGRYIAFRLTAQPAGNKATVVPAYVTENGFTSELNSRTKVGAAQGSGEWMIYDTRKDSVLSLKTDDLPGIADLPDYLKDYPSVLAEREKKKTPRPVSPGAAWWSPDGSRLVINIFSQDNKDRWIVLWNPETGKMSVVDRQRDEAWIGGPGIGGAYGGSNGGWINHQTVWYQSEADGYSHIYLADILSGTKKQLTQGNFEVQNARLSNDRTAFYVTTNETHPGEKNLYKWPVNGGQALRITTLPGANEAVVSPDERWIAFRRSFSNVPWELYLQRLSPGAQAEQITDKGQSPLFKSYPWKEPELIQITARDGAKIPARLYRPEKPHPSRPAVIFVHGAGYLQNAHKWWSSYFREYMFHNLLTEQGYTVLDIDYRGSAGYGRDWRTGIYRHMGGKDLTDHVDAARYLIKSHGIDSGRIGIYGGSYGGFITLMALFTQPGVFAAGAALRPVTDWAHYNHGYTSNILNTPAEDSIAYRRSSPIYHAAGLSDALLICHGMIDVNVHFQDVVRLQQKLIELGKDNWELAAYPMEDHGFVTPSSWTDEYKRILKIFETNLKR